MVTRLPCETTSRPPLSRAEFAEALPYFLADYVIVMRFAVRTLAPTSTMLQLYDAVLQYDIPQLDVLNKVVGFVLWELDAWKRKTLHQQLTLEEETVVAAAWRLSDSMHGNRDTT